MPLLINMNYEYVLRKLKQYQKYMTDNNFDIAITSYDLI